MGQCMGRFMHAVHARSVAARFGYHPTPDLPESMSQLASTVELLLAKEENMSVRIEEQKKLVRQYMQEGDRRKAGAALKRAKLLEISLDKTTAMRVGVEAHRDNLGEANVNMDVAQALSSSSKAMRATFGGNTNSANMVQMEKMVDDMEESLQDCAEISQLLAEPLQAGMASLEDFDVDAELRSFAENDDLDSRRQSESTPVVQEGATHSASLTHGLPLVPKHKPSLGDTHSSSATTNVARHANRV